MSGPKSYSVTVVSPQELERRALVAAIARLETVRRRAAALNARIEAARSVYAGLASQVETVDIPRAGSSSKTCATIQEQLASRCDRAERALDDVIAAHRAAALLEAAGSVLTAPVEGAVVAAGSPALERRRRAAEAAQAQAAQAVPVAGAEARKDAAAKADAEWFSRLAPRVSASLAQLGAVSRERRQEIDELARSLLETAQRNQATILLHRLQDEVRAVSRSVTRQRELDRVREEFEARIAALPQASLRAELLTQMRHVAKSEPIPASLLGEFETAERAGIAEQDRRFALGVTTQCLEELGYEVQPGFETASADGRLGYLRRADWPGYAVQVRSAPGSGQLRFNVVRSSSVPGDVVRDREVEESWCGDLDAARTRAATAGVDLHRISAEPAGAMPVQVVTDQRLATFGQRREARERPAQMYRRLP